MSNQYHWDATTLAAGLYVLASYPNWWKNKSNYLFQIKGFEWDVVWNSSRGDEIAQCTLVLAEFSISKKPSLDDKKLFERSCILKKKAD